MLCRLYLGISVSKNVHLMMSLVVCQCAILAEAEAQSCFSPETLDWPCTLLATNPQSLKRTAPCTVLSKWNKISIGLWITVIPPSKESCSLCTHPISLPAYSDAGRGPGHCNIMAHPWFTLTSQAQTGFSSPSSFFTLSSTLTFTHFSLSLSPALSFHIFFISFWHSPFFNVRSAKTPPPRSPLLPLILPPTPLPSLVYL